MMCKTQSLGRTPDGIYSTRSAYRIQFRGSHRTFQHDLIRKAHAENKCTVHAWILMHGKILTADHLEKRGWPHQEHFPCVMGRWRQEFIYFCVALSQELFGTGFSPRRISGCISHNRTLQAWLIGGRKRQARCLNRNTGGSMEYSFTLCGTCRKRGIRESLKMPT